MTEDPLLSDINALVMVAIGFAVMVLYYMHTRGVF